MPAEPRHSGNLRGVLWMIFGAVFFTLATVLIRVASVKFTIFEIVFYRVLIGSAIMAPWLFRAGLGVLRTPRLPLFALRAGFSYVAMLCFVFAVGNMPLAEMTALQFTLPLCITLAAVVVLRETVGVHRMAALLVGFSGVLVMLRPGLMEVSLAAMLILLSTVFYTGSHITIKVLSRSESSDLIVFYGFLLTIPVAMVPLFFVAAVPGWTDAPVLIGIGLFSVLAHAGLVRAFANAEASMVAPFDFLRLPMTAALAFVLFAEWPDGWTWIGALIVFGAVTYSARREVGQ
jgi:S-adenosylmethionine uptake transporter